MAKRNLLTKTVIIVKGGVIQDIITESKDHPVFIIVDHDNDKGKKQYTFPALRYDEKEVSSLLASEKNQ